MKLEMAKFLQDTIEDSAVKRKGAKGDTVREFVQFMDKVLVEPCSVRAHCEMYSGAYVDIFCTPNNHVSRHNGDEIVLKN